MSFRLVPKSVTLNNLERSNGVFQRIQVASGSLRKSSRSLSHLLMSSCSIEYYFRLLRNMKQRMSLGQVIS